MCSVTGRAITVLVGVMLVLVPASAGGTGRSAQSLCERASLEPGYAARVSHALRATEDVWGNELLASPEGPTFEAARRYLEPLFLAKGPHGAPLTTSGAYYVPFSGPVGVDGAGSMSPVGSFVKRSKKPEKKARIPKYA